MQVSGPATVQVLLCLVLNTLWTEWITTLDTVAHTLQFNWHTVTNHQAIDALVYALSIELFINNRIECSQPTADRLEFSTDAHCMLAQLALSADSRFSVTRV